MSGIRFSGFAAALAAGVATMALLSAGAVAQEAPFDPSAGSQYARGGGTGQFGHRDWYGIEGPSAQAGQLAAQRYGGQPYGQPFGQPPQGAMPPYGPPPGAMAQGPAWPGGPPGMPHHGPGFAGPGMQAQPWQEGGFPPYGQFGRAEGSYQGYLGGYPRDRQQPEPFAQGPRQYGPYGMQQPFGQDRMATQQWSEMPGWQQSFGMAGQPADMAGHVNLVGASDLVGRPVQDRQGRAIGEVEYVMIDAASGALRLAVIGGGELEDGRYIAVPWSALQRAEGQGFRLAIGRERLAEAPRLTRDRIADLTQPRILARVRDFYAVPDSGQTSSGQQRESGQESSAAGTQTGTQATTGTQTTPGTQTGTESAGAAADSVSQTGSQAPAAPQQPGAGTGEIQGQPGGSGEPHVLIGRQIVTMIAPPALVSPTEMRGTEIVGPMGQPIGEIDQIMIDIDHGQVAYVLLSQGGYLGMNREWLPVPFQALRWLPQRQTYALDVHPAQLQALPRLAQGPLPRRVSVQQLAMLHHQYGVPPYWVTMAGRSGMGMDSMAPAAGVPGAQDWMSSDEIRERLEAQGFTDVEDLDRDGGMYQARASRDGQTYVLQLDAETGAIQRHRLTASSIRDMLEEEGYSEISDLQREGDIYRVQARRNGEEVTLQVDATTGAVRSEDGAS